MPRPVAPGPWSRAAHEYLVVYRHRGGDDEIRERVGDVSGAGAVGGRARRRLKAAG